jgi:hypothetical protein
MCVGVTVWFGWIGVVWYPDAGWSTASTIYFELLEMTVRIDCNEGNDKGEN